jgi:hypothetical protein
VNAFTMTTIEPCSINLYLMILVWSRDLLEKIFFNLAWPISLIN